MFQDDMMEIGLYDHTKGLTCLLGTVACSFRSCRVAR